MAPAPLSGPRLHQAWWRLARRLGLWTLLVFVLTGVVASFARRELRTVALNRARDSYHKDLVYRLWATQRGGVYVPLDEKTPPNPYLAHLPDREIQGSNGKTYTLVNPAYMTRMVHELGAEGYGLQGHLTSLKPLRPQNAPDPWERKVLESFDRGAAEGWEEVGEGSQRFLRYMGAFKVQEGCLRCHAQQGYRVGDVRGGISVTVPMEGGAFLGASPEHRWHFGILGLFWAAGMGSIVALDRRERRFDRERQASLAALGESQALYQSLVDDLPLPLYRTDGEGRIQFANTAFLAECQRASGTVIGTSLCSLLPPELAALHREENAQVLRGERVRRMEARTADGEARWVEVLKHPVRDAHGSVVGIQGMTWDISDRVLSEQRLLESEQRFRTLLESLPVPVFLQRGRTLTYCNPAGARMLGAPDASGILGRDLLAFVHADHQALVLERTERCLETLTMAPRIEHTLLTLEGRPFQAEVVGIPVSLHGEAAILVFAEDVTERRASEAERRRMEEEIQHAQRLESLGHLAGGVAHDMNNVLAAILGLGTTLRARAGEDAAQAKAMDIIVHAAERGRELVKGLTDFARKGLKETLPVDLNEVVRREGALLNRTTLQKVEVLLELEASLPLVMGDPHALGNALMNLCVNALDAMPEGGILRISTGRVEDGQVELAVSDTGEGMPPEVAARALEPFFTTKPAGQGTGLGLSVVYGTVKSHGGQMELSSLPGIGTRVVLRFPGLSSVAGPGTAWVAEAAPSRCLSILLVDDDELVRGTVPEMLGNLGHVVETEAGGAEALKRLSAGLQVDLVILDLNMPGMSGLETLQRLRTQRPDLPVLIASGYKDAQVDQALAGIPKVSVLMKPYTLEEFRDALQRIG